MILKMCISSLKDSDNEKKVPSVSQREMTFLNFASVEYEGNVYMTPQDFLDSITEDKPRRKDQLLKYIEVFSHLGLSILITIVI